MDESTTRALLIRVLADAPPPAPVDLDRVVKRAEEERRHRSRWVVATLTAAALVLVVAGVAAAVGTFRDADPRVPSAKASATEQVASDDWVVYDRPAAGGPPVDHGMPTSAPHRFDVMRSELKVEGVPEILVQRSTSVREGSLSFHAAGRYEGTRRRSLGVLVGAKGVKVDPFPNGEPKEVTDGPPIHGKPSQWYLQPDFGDVLRWQWAPGAYAAVTVDDIEEPLKLATQIANTLSVNLNAQARLPFTIAAPDDFTLREFQTSVGRGSPAASLAYGGPGTSFISINVNLVGTGIGDTNTTIDDRPARVTEENEFLMVTMGTGDLKVTGGCTHRPNPTLTEPKLREVCLTTTASTEQVADLEEPNTWVPYAPR